MSVPSATAAGVRVRKVPDGASLNEFIQVSWTINGGDPHWVPPLRMSVRNALDRRKHPFHQHAAVAYFVADREGRTTGRVAAIQNHLHNEFHDDRVGFFGLFECEDDRTTAAALLDAAAAWLRERGLERMRGPVHFSTNEEIASPGVLVEGFDTPPVVMMGHNPPYYERLLEEYGLEKEQDLFAFWFTRAEQPERITKGFDRLLERLDATVRPLDIRRFRQEVDVIKEIYNSAWQRNWGFVPMTDAEFEHLAKEFRPVLDPDLCLIAEVRGEPVGFSLALPDLNRALRHIRDGRLFPLGLLRFLWHRRKIRSLRLITLGFKPGYQHQGLGAALYSRTWQTGVAKGYECGEGSWILEENLEMMRPLERLGARAYKRYRVYERAL